MIDPYLRGRGEDLAAHIRMEMGRCTQLLAVISYNTSDSQWVPWEIGMATEKDYPLATYSSASLPPPEFLRRWPYLRTEADLDRYASASKSARSSLVSKRSYLTEGDARRDTTREFYRTLRGSLGSDRPKPAALARGGHRDDRVAMNEEEITRRLDDAVDRLAAIEHERWAHWQAYMHEAGERLPDGRLILPAEQVARWDRQIATPFGGLGDDEKESDRDQVRRYLPEIVAILTGG